MDGPNHTLSNTYAQFYSHVPSPQYLVSSASSSSSSSENASEGAGDSVGGSGSHDSIQSINELSTVDNRNLVNWEMKWLFDSTSTRPGGLSSLDQFLGGGRVDPHHFESTGFGESPFAVQNILVIMILCAGFACLCRIMLFTEDPPELSSNTFKAKRLKQLKNLDETKVDLRQFVN